MAIDMMNTYQGLVAFHQLYDFHRLFVLVHLDGDVGQVWIEILLGDGVMSA